MQIANAEISTQQSNIIPFKDVQDDVLLQMSDAISGSNFGIKSLLSSIEKDVIPLLTSIEKNTRFIDPVKSIRKKNRSQRIVNESSVTKDHEKLVEKRRATQPLKSAPTGRLGKGPSPAPAMPVKVAPTNSIKNISSFDVDTRNATLSQFVDSKFEKSTNNTSNVSGGRKAENSLRKRETSMSVATNKSESKAAQEKIEDKKEKKRERATLGDSLRKAISDGWSGKFIGDANKDDNVTDAVGQAGAGVEYSAAKEIWDATESIRSKSEDKTSMLGVFKKYVQDKTGITYINDKIESAKQKMTEKIMSWADKGGTKVDVNKHEKSVQEQRGFKKDKNGKLRDASGRFVSGPTKTLVEDSSKEQISATERIEAVLKDNEKKEQGRHDDLLNTVANAGAAGGGGGIFSSIVEGFVEGKVQKGFGGKGKGSGRLGKIGSKLGGKFGKVGKIASKLGGGVASIGGKLGSVASIAAGVMGVGGIIPGMGMLGGLFGGGETKNEGPTTAKTARVVSEKTGIRTGAKTASAATPAVAEGAKSSSVFSKVASKIPGAKSISKIAQKGGIKTVLSGAGKMLKVLGPIAAVASAGYDAYSGYNDKDLQKETFGLKDGQEATTGQKAASSVAGLANGLTFGALGTLGLEDNIAKAIYNVFGGDKNTEAIVNKQEGKKPEKISTVLEKQKIESSKEGDLMKQTKPSIDKLTKQLEKLNDKLDSGDKQSARFGSKRDSKSSTPIETEFGDSMLTMLAYDRL